jgi:hypothetical protein
VCDEESPIYCIDDPDVGHQWKQAIDDEQAALVLLLRSFPHLHRLLLKVSVLSASLAQAITQHPALSYLSLSTSPGPGYPAFSSHFRDFSSSRCDVSTGGRSGRSAHLEAVSRHVSLRRWAEVGAVRPLPRPPGSRSWRHHSSGRPGHTAISIQKLELARGSFHCQSIDIRTSQITNAITCTHSHAWVCMRTGGITRFHSRGRTPE